MTVTKAQLTITASSGSMTYGGSVPTITPAYSGWKNGEGPGSLTTQATCSTTATSSSPASPPTYPSSCNGAVDPNYSFNYVAGSVTVSKAPLTITASNGSMTYGGTAPTITPAYSGFVNGDTSGSLTTPADVLDDGHELEPGLATDVPVLLHGCGGLELRHQLPGWLGDGDQGPADDHRLQRFHDLRRDGRRRSRPPTRASSTATPPHPSRPIPPARPRPRARARWPARRTRPPVPERWTRTTPSPTREAR